MGKKLFFSIIPSVLISLVLVLVGISAISLVLLKDNSIPSTLEECYRELAFLSEDEIKDIRNAGNGNLFRRSYGLPDDFGDDIIAEGFDLVEFDLSSTHFGLGRWIRNNWIYPSLYSNISCKFLVAGVMHPDEMSSMIITGYHMYLNDIPYRIPIQTGARVTYAIIALIFTSSLALLIIGKYRK